MKETSNFIIEVPQDSEINNELKRIKKEHIESLKDTIKKQYIEVSKNLDIEISKKSKSNIENCILATQDLIDNCIKDNYYYINKDDYFLSLIYVCHKLDLKVETYKIKEELERMNKTSDSICKKQEKLDEQNNNLVYNLLGFLTAFSIVSGVVSAIEKIEGIINVMIFMVFTMLILVTTLIALNNFYKSNNNKKNIFQNNYFIWVILLVTLIILALVSGIKYLDNNKEYVSDYLDKKIENIVEYKLDNYN